MQNNNHKFKCRICEGNLTKRFIIREMMFGTKDQFIYWECENCGCLQIENYPSNISKYYPADYYSFEQVDFNEYNPKGFSLNIRISIRLYNQLVFKGFLGNLRKTIYKPCVGPYEFLAEIKAKPWFKILDVGCGNGRFLCELYNMGFKRLMGVDKYISEDFNLFKKIKILKKDIYEIDGKFDLITINHALEHMESQSEIFKSTNKLLKKNGYFIVRIPIKNEAWNIYKEDWVQIDAPRHYYIHSIKSIKTLAFQTGFHLEDIKFDSLSIQFWGSEQYRKNIPLRGDIRSYAENKSNILFSPLQIKEWETETTKLNDLGKGDQAMFIFKKN